VIIVSQDVEQDSNLVVDFYRQTDR
jgi:hypothetical protein